MPGKAMDNVGPLLRVRGLSKSFPGLRALDDVDFEVSAGEIVAVVGQNGSGKSTVVKILAGVYQADPGAVVEVRSPGGELLKGAAAQAELHFIHQDLGLIPLLSTVENLDLGRSYGGRVLGPAKFGAERRRAEELIASFGADFDVTVPIAELTASERTIVAIARALDGWSSSENVLILDEPTAALHGDEVGRLFEAVRRVAASGAGVVFISHHLDEVMDLADRVVVLRDGHKIADVGTESVDHGKLVELIVGREVLDVRVEGTAGGEPVLDVRGLTGPTVDGVDLRLAAGEIVGATGIIGSGRERLASLIFGAIRPTGGEIFLQGSSLKTGDPRASVRAGLGLVPADRRGAGAVMTMSAGENLTLPRLRPLRRALGRLDGRAERAEVARWAEEVELRPNDPGRPLELFSGGNQQKVVLAKWLRNEPKVLLLDEPTQGVDVGAKAQVHELIGRAAAAGAAVLVSSSDTKELTVLCDRVLVMREGRIVAELRRAELSEARLVTEGLGIARSEAEEIFGQSLEVADA